MSNFDQLEFFVQKLKSVFDNSPEGMVISDMTIDEQPIIYSNNTFLDMTGYTKQEIVGRNCRFLQGEDREQIGIELIKAAIQTDTSCRVILRNYRKNGTLFYNRLSLFPIRDKENSTKYYVGLQDDITSLILSKEQIDKLNEDKETLLSEVHHRVKNNLAVVSSLLELEMNTESAFQTLQKSRMRIKSMSTVHENLYSEEGLSRVDFDKVIRSIKDSYPLLREDNQPKLDYNIKAASVSLNINQAIPLSIILSELVQNVYKHAYEGGSSGQIDIQLNQSPDNQVTLSVSDKGKGIDDTVICEKPSTMGYTLINTLTSQLGGSITCRTGDGSDNGLKTEITFSKKDTKGSSQAHRIS